MNANHRLRMLACLAMILLGAGCGNSLLSGSRATDDQVVNQDMQGDDPLSDGNVNPGGDLQISPTCGNGTLEAGEVCEGADLNGKTCQSYGFFGGDLVCSMTCQLDLRGCEDPPSDVDITGVSSGVLVHGQRFTLSGSGFGVKIPAAPHLWDDFEGHAVGETIASPVVGAYTQVGIAKYAMEDSYSGNMAALSEVRADSSGAPGLVSHWIDKGVSQNGFASMKWKIVGDITPHNIKLIRLNAHEPDPTHGYPNFNIGNERGQTHFSGIVNHGSIDGFYVGGFSEYSSDWNSIQIYDHLSTPDSPNGFVGRRINGELMHVPDVVTLLGNSESLDGLRSAYFCGYLSHDGSDADLWLDDVYADITLARIEIVGPTGIREMQIPEVWADGEITARFNAGAYPPGTEVRIYVYNAGNHMSNGYTVTIGD